MRKKLLLIILITHAFFLCTYSQIVWAPQSAQWIYNGQGQSSSYIEIEYVKDTVLLGKQSKVLKKTEFTYRSQTNDIVSSFLGYETTYEEDSVVYLYTYNQFDTLFSFNSSIGDTWKLNCYPNSGICQKNGTVTVQDTGTIIIKNRALKYLAVLYNFDTIIGNKPYIVKDTVIERIGSKCLYILPWDIVYSMIDGNEGGMLRCYSDNELGTYSNNYNKPCNFLTSINDIKNLDFNLYPNPCSNFIKIDNINSTKAYLEIKNITGNILLSKKVFGKSQIIDVSIIPRGIYLFILITTKGKLYRKFIKT